MSDQMIKSEEAPLQVFGRPLLVAAGLVIAAGVVFRLLWLGRVPGVNADETWYALQAVSLVRGEGVQWRTPTGNPLSPFMLVPQVLMLVAGGPSFGGMRAPNVVLNIGLLWLVWRELRSRAGAGAGMVGLLLVAALPTAISYSRYAVDSSQSLLVCWLALMAARRGRWGWWLAVMGVAFMVHPTNVLAVLYTAPLVVWPWVSGERRLSRGQWALAAAAGTAAGAAVLWRFRGFVASGAGQLGERLASVNEWVKTPLLVARLVSGSTVYGYFCGAGQTGWDLAWDVVWLVLLAGVLAGVVYRWRRFGEREPLLVAAGVVATIAVLYVLRGNAPFLPRQERYSLVILAPILWLTAVQVTAWLPPRRGVAAAAVVAAVFLGSFWHGYFGWLQVHNSQGEFAFATAATEPKEAAFEVIRGDLGDAQSAVVCAQDWWVQKPLELLAAAEPRLRVLACSEFGEVTAGRRRVDRFYVAVFADKPQYPPLAAYVAAHTEHTWQLADAQGRLLITVYRCTPPDEAE